MATTIYPLATVAAQVTAAGISSPSFADILASYQASVRSIFGSDVYIDPDSKDGQLLAILAQAQYDSNQCAIATYNSYNPQTAVGTALDSAVKVNGIVRQSASASTVVLTLGGQTGTTIYNGVVQDNLSRLWDLPSVVIIPDLGEIDVLAICETLGALQAQPNTITLPFTAVVGWQSVTNKLAAVPGAPVETDGQLRERQTISTSLTSLTTSDALLARVLNVPGVVRAQIYVNDTPAPDANGIPANSFSMVVQGGVDLDIANAIEIAKDVGAGTFGTTSVNVTTAFGLTNVIHFDRLIEVPVTVAVTIHKLTGFSGSSSSKIAAALIQFVNALGIGDDVYHSWMTAVASLSSDPTFYVVSLTQARDGGALSTADITVAFNEAATLNIANITVTLENP